MSNQSRTESALDLKRRYRSNEDHLGRDFFGPVLSQARTYDRAAGYFSSGSLNSWAAAVPELVKRSARVRLIIAAELSSQDRAALVDALEASEEAREMEEDEISHRLVDAATSVDGPDASVADRSRLLAWLIASGLVELRFAWFIGNGGQELYHEKFGVVEFADGQRVAFTGSANETSRGHGTNLERLDVFRSWKPGEGDRIQDMANDFGRTWGGSPEIRIRRLAARTLEMVKVRAPQTCPPLPPAHEPTGPDPLTDRWRHQEEAVTAFLAEGRGILEMATGTGKTRTSLKALTKLAEDQQIDSVIVCTSGNDLLEQWHKELLPWCAGRTWGLSRFYGKHDDGSSFYQAPHQAALICSRYNLPKVLPHLSIDQKRRILIIHDEVHGLGQPSSRDQLRGQHAAVGFTLGLSATPEREYDEQGTEFIASEIGPVVYQFGLEEAIERGILVEFDYEVLEFDITEGDRERIQQVHKKKAARLREGRPMSQEEEWIEISKVYKTAEEKMPRLQEYLRKSPNALDRSIIFVETKEYAAPLFETLHALGKRFSQYFDSDKPEV
ncbi:DEAD/DEAH box helicase family protein, partial [bacterium]|nr:DEAD/DEAH box helicase family protein [bacterium]